MLGGWASGSKYSLLGALRAAAQVVSYELILGLALVGVVLVSGTLSLGDIVAGQARIGPLRAAPAARLRAVPIAAVAETNRAPFDLPEAEHRAGGRLPHRVQRDALRDVSTSPST